GATARDILRTASREALARFFRVYGEEKRARAIAQEVVRERERGEIATTTQLARLVERVLGRKRGQIHPATRVFQALRIAVNKELENLPKGLERAVQVLRSGGRLAAISFHSLEDRIVKQFFLKMSTGCVCPPEFPVCVCHGESLLRVITRKPVTPTAREIRGNPRARSAKLRVAEKL
ncbi:MAG: 16S rRNA (cytosine(1402)-N(4))-methyltransferase RsmH, partial [Gammaproteobacteria bacterium]